MQVTLSGGDLGGEVVDWDQGQSEMTFDGHVYRLISDTLTAAFIGMDT